MYMTGSYDAIVVGAGVIGSAVAFELARSGKSVCVFDKAAGPGQGSTSSSSAVIRFNYSTFDAVALSWEAFHAWLNWQDHLEATSNVGLVSVHNIGVAMMNVPVVNVERTSMLFTQAGIEHRVLDADGLREVIPGIDTGKYWPPKKIDDPQFWEDASESISAMYTTQGGYVSDPLQAAVNLADAAKAKGVDFRFKSRVISINKENARVSGVTLDDGTIINAPVLVNVAGPWSGHLNEMAGAGADFTIQVRPMRQEVHHVSAPKSLVNPPIIGDLDTGVYIRPEGGGSLLVGGTEPECDVFQWVDDPDQTNMTRTQELFDAQVTRAARRLPDLQVPGSASGVVGVYDVASDWTPIYDKTDVPGFYVAIGSSGNQFKNAPTAGQLMAALIDAVESGADHDSQPVHFVGPRTGLTINIGTFSRKRAKNEASSGTVMG